MARSEAYRKAEEMIEEARRSGAKELDLSSRHMAIAELTELPESLGQLTQLQKLNLAGNQLTALPDVLGQLTQLQDLYLSGNQLTALPDVLGQLTQLQKLNLSGNQLTALPDVLGQLTQLQDLHLSGNQLTALPDVLGQLTQLQDLDLSGNRLTALPDVLQRVPTLEKLYIMKNHLAELPQWIGQLSALTVLSIGGNRLTTLPESFSTLRLTWLYLGLGAMGQLGEPVGNPLARLPEAVRRLRCLTLLRVNNCHLGTLPEWIGDISSLEQLFAENNRLTDVPDSLATLPRLKELTLEGNQLNPELAAAYKEGLDAVIRYLGAKVEAHVVLNEAKLILIGEGEVGKSCLLGALRGDPWEEGRPTTHGIEIKPVKVVDPDTGTEITLNAWDFGGQRVYRPTHQLFFSAPAVYLVVWKPREGPQQGFVKEWIKLVKHREPDARILIVATHGGPKERQPDIDRQEIWDLFGKETVIDFLSVESKPDEETGERCGIAKLKDVIARVAAGLPELGRTFPRHWHEARTTLRGLLSLGAVLPLLPSLVRDAREARARVQRLGANRLCLERVLGELRDLVRDEKNAREELSKARVAYLPLDRTLAICREHKVEEADARLLLRICHRVGDLIHYEHDPALRDLVVLKPDWLATAISYVLDDKQTREAHGLVEFARLGNLWNDPARPAESRYDASLQPLFLRLMERFDLSYKVAVPAEPEDALGFWQRVGRTCGATKQATAGLHYTSLIAQLVPDVRPEADLAREWPERAHDGDGQQMQICRIVETKNGQSATAEGLFYQLIVRLHKYSLGRVDYRKSVHWQRGLVLDDDYNGQALLEHVGNDVRITVRAAYPERFLSVLTNEVRWLVANFWKGLRCDVMVPCVEPCGRNAPGTGLYDVRSLIESKRVEGATKFPCPVCNRWQNIDALLRNAPAARRDPVTELLENFQSVKVELGAIRPLLQAQHGEVMRRFDTNEARILSRVDDAYTRLMRAFADEAKDGPRLFSLQPVERSAFNPNGWVKKRFRVTLWCEHTRLPLPLINRHEKEGVYEFDVTREWFAKAGPFLKALAGTLGLVLPVAASATKLAIDEAAYRAMENQLDFGKECAEAIVTATEETAEWLAEKNGAETERAGVVRAHAGVLREFQTWLKKEDPSFGDLRRVLNKRQEFLWVHRDFENEY